MITLLEPAGSLSEPNFFEKTSLPFVFFARGIEPNEAYPEDWPVPMI
jgi:hypothetical protein